MSRARKRLVVTGQFGQVARSLLEKGKGTDFDIVPLGRPGLDLARPETIDLALRGTSPDVIVSAAAYTFVDKAESEEALANAINGVAPGTIGAAAAALGVPLIHLSTDYVFDGEKPAAYVESDPTRPIGAYGRSKLAGEVAVRSATDNHVILRTSWVYSPFGSNFLKTMLRLAEGRSSIDVVDDQIGSPTSALDIADGILRAATNLIASEATDLRGVFHMTGSGEASWADFAAEIFLQSAKNAGTHANVNRILTSQYPTAANRPANSRLNSMKLAQTHGIRLRDWRIATAETVSRVLNEKIKDHIK